ncbi:hypothetical protein [Azohydromonas sediminis]|uniref:hypothetical protein n=1 Tax=Azohydromonas sediminis TaxID=2259674 RepID=UPI000E647D45|nr:hypothetical protein [Azohydromonas sediminis]
MESIAQRIHALAPIGEPVELPAAGTWLENPFVYDAAAREIKALTRDGCTEIVSERHAHTRDGEPIVVHLVFKRLC